MTCIFSAPRSASNELPISEPTRHETDRACKLAVSHCKRARVNDEADIDVCFIAFFAVDAEHPGETAAGAMEAAWATATSAHV
jgi:hypothetical protein